MPKNRWLLLLAGSFLIGLPCMMAQQPVNPALPPFRDPDLPFEKRVADLLSQLTVPEKISQLMMASPAIPRLGIPAYHWWNEALHGTARNGRATVFPQAIALAATWNPALHQQIAEAISTEARAKNNETLRRTDGSTRIYEGLTIWSPNINIFRDPRWGRGQETYGEDPYLTGRFGVAFVRGLQGSDPRYLKTVATVKHFAVHSGPEEARHRFDAVISERDLRETYLPAFEACIREGGAQSLMSAYNAIDGIPAPANRKLLTGILRDEWGFRGAVVGDVDTVSDIFKPGSHHYVKDAAEASAAALKAGNDLCSGTTYKDLPEALQRGLVTEADLDTALRRLLLLRFRLGQFDPPALIAYRSIPASENDSSAHDQLALEAARQSLVLLKNDGTLPWNAKEIKTLAVLGPTADDKSALLGNYNGTPSHPVTILQGLRNELEPLGVKILSERSVPLVAGGQQSGQPGPAGALPSEATPGTPGALAIARQADHILLTLGLTPGLEGEEMHFVAEGFNHGDRTSILLPRSQRDFIDQIAALGKPFTVVLTGGGAVSFDTAKPNAVLMAWYYGQRGGDAVAQTLLGEVNPGGHSPVTFYQSDADLPAFEDYAMANRTYRYFEGVPLFPFGHGLSYTAFKYGALETAAGDVPIGTTVRLKVNVENTGSRDGDEVVQIYARQLDPKAPQPIHHLIAFQRVRVPKGASVAVALEFNTQQLRYWDEAKNAYTVDPGEYELQAGSSSRDLRASARMRLVARDPAEPLK